MKNNKTARIVGCIFLIQFIIGILVNQFLIGPVAFSEDYLTSIFANSNKIIIGVLVSIVSGIISIGAAVLLYPIFKKHSKGIALLFLNFSIVGFVILAIDNVLVLSLLSLSEEYTNSNILSLQDLGAVLYKTRWWTHYLEMLVACFPLFVFYFALFRIKLIPRFISLWGIISVILMCIAVMFAIFDQGTLMILFLPLALNQLVLFPWLIFKGFK